MASTEEDLARLLVSIELSVAKVEKQAAAVAKAGERAAKKIDDDFKGANENVGKSFERGGKKAIDTTRRTGAAVSQLSFQLNDIAMGLASGTSPFTIMVQQGSQVTQALSMAGGGAGGAVRALGGAFASMVNPVSLATFAIIGLGGAAVQYFTSFLSDSEDAEKTLKEQAELIGRVADKWGDALPALKAYNDERKSLQDNADLKGAVDAAVKGEYAPLRKTIAEINIELVDLQAKLQALGANESEIVTLQQTFAKLTDDIKKGDASVSHLKDVQAALSTLYTQTHIPAAKQMAEAIGQIADELERTIAAGNKLKADAALLDFYNRSPLGGLSPLESGGGNFLNPQQAMDFRAGQTKSQFEQELDKASGAIESFVDRVIKAESGGNANAKNPNSSATGAGQFIESTWLDLFKRYFPQRAEGMTRGAILALRADANTSRALIEAYAKENAAVLQSAGVHVDEAALQLAHFLGAGDAAKVLKAASGTPLAGLITQASIDANPTILGGGRTVDDARAYAERRANASTTGGASKKSPADIFQGSLQDVQKRIDLLNAEYAAQSQLNPAVNDYGFALEKARIKQQLLSEAQKAGLEITPELSAKIDALAGNYAKASAASGQLQESQQRLAQATQEFNDFSKDLLGGFISDLRSGKSAAEALANAVGKIGDKLLDAGLDALFGGLGGGGGFLSFLPKLFGFANGGVASRGRPLPTFAKGGVSRSAAVFGEAGPEAAVPLPDGRSIPVTLSAPRVPAGGASGGKNLHVTVGVSADNNGNLMPFVESVSERTVKKAAPGIVGASVKTVKGQMGNLMSEAQARQA